MSLSPPPWLSEGARRKWEELAPHLVAMGVATIVDADALSAYCECFERWRRLAGMAAKSPPVFKRGQGEGDEVVFVKNPLWSQVRDAEAALRVMAREFGFTPSARSGLRVGSAVAAAAERLLTDG